MATTTTGRHALTGGRTGARWAHAAALPALVLIMSGAARAQAPATAVISPATGSSSP